jgi:methylthioribose-1-phosphate isomerase
MKKIVRLTESQLARVIKKIVKEAEESSQPSHCTTKLFKQSEIDTQDMEGFKGIGEAAALKVLIGKSGTKFKVKDTYGSVNLNRKPAYEGAIITPDTTITICNSGYITMSGMGYPDAMLYYDDDKIMFKKQHA